MCGIFFSLSRHGFVTPDSRTEQLLKNRGPDSLGTEHILISNDGDTPSSKLHATFISTVLSLRGTALTEQPLKDADTGSILCWNGEAWTIAGQPVSGSDSRAVYDALFIARGTDANISRLSAIEATVQVLSSIRGPYAFVFYDARSRCIFYGRDCLGRRSLLRKTNDALVLSSVCDNATGESWAEIEADGIYLLDLNETPSSLPSASHIPHRRRGDATANGLHLDVPFPEMNRCAFVDTPRLPFEQKTAVHQIGHSLRKSLVLRVQHVREAVDLSSPHQSDLEARIVVLFSGGLDCTVLARLVHDLIPVKQSVDLLNVAFENPRVHSNLGPNESPYELCPDRITGRTSHAELSKVCPDRTWRFVEINVPYSDTVAKRSTVMALMHPHNTEMDLSISYALYFASKAAGVIRDSKGVSTPYTSAAHVLLSGLGADELFGGYQRHAVAFARKGYPGLLDELELDFNRLGKRNLGRDDRVISDSGKEVRFPYLDEDFIAIALKLPVFAKCNFGAAQSSASDDPAQSLEPAKKVLRLLAWELGMKGVAAEKKRAIQFGARTAKMETGKTKGTQVLI
ncbi:hypothetical protein K458DRAFT_307800 [Lentithecium fluviatile CBS 122367]|uniref:Glutamine amidotransferase type-2 domain-containing protein n=1 Tax=Lentithecium fluviatile CBS 122367 TaxID=1168545 RepID=A0A6G1IVK0_9PLEO|nr:hypothetical protein K458DRAFT_307800 [Lentithecium fluviatile CBS 122367]